MIIFYKFSFLLFIFLIINKFNLKIKKGLGLFIIILFADFYIGNFYSTTLFLTILTFTTIYTYDDLKTLSASIRIILQILSGVIVYLFFNNDISLSLLIFIFASFFFVNLLNFHDGLDLNISLYIFLFLFSLYLYDLIDLNFFNQVIFNNLFWFFLIFSFFNVKYKFYVGDSGCFALTFIILYFLFNEYSNIKLILLMNLFLFPLVDSSYVTVLRLIRKENLLTRNYYHLYHLFEKKYFSYSYLLAPLINFIVLYLCQSLVKVNIFLTLLIYILITLTFYFFTRFLVVRS